MNRRDVLFAAAALPIAAALADAPLSELEVRVLALAARESTRFLY